MVEDMELIAAFGLMVTVKVKDAPTQLPGAGAVGVTVYTAVFCVLVVLFKLPVITPVAENAAPSNKPGESSGISQLNIVLAGTIPLIPGAPTAGVTVKPTPSQNTAVIAFM